MQSFEEAYYEAESFWSDGAVQDERNLTRMARTAELVPPDARTLLDVGCGNGVFGHQLQLHRPELKIFGVDRSQAALQHVRFEKQKSAIDSLPFDDNQFDCVTCLQVIEHLPVNVYDKALHELNRIARKYIIIGVPFKEVLENNFTRCPSCKSTFNIDLHLRSYDYPELESLFRNREFRLDQVVFPDERTRKKYLHHVTGLLKKSPTLRSFVVPVCPICGYSEGDKTMLSVAGQDGASETSPRTIIKNGLKRILDPLWPVEQVPGYWVICRYSS